MRQILTVGTLLLLTFSLLIPAQAQVLEKGFSAGAHAGATQAFTDVTNSDINASFGALVQYNLTPFTFGNVEYSTGVLARKELDIYAKRYSNNFNRITATANVSLGQLLKPNYRIAHYLLYNIYAGTGVGLILSNISEPNALTPDGFGGITYKGADLTIPVNIGFNIKPGGLFSPNSPINISLNLQHNFAFTEMLDGYDPKNDDNQMKDSFSSLNVGIKYNFGTKKAFF